MNFFNPLLRIACVGVAILSVAACRSAPTRLHSLTILASASGARDYSGPPLRVDVVHLPAELNRPEIITPMVGGREIHDADHWAAPLPTLARDTLTADLLTRLPPGKVIVAPLAKPDGALGLDVAILELGRSGDGPRFLVSWQINRGKSPIEDSALIVLKHERSQTTAEVVDGVSELLAQTADRIAARLTDPGGSELR